MASFFKFFNKIKKKKQHPLLIQNTNYFSEFDQSLPLTEYDFVVCDTELTGLNKKQDEIISIGAVKIVNLKIDMSSCFHQYIRPEKIDHNQATLIHRITPEQLRAAPTIYEVLPKFMKFCGKSLLVGHFVDIDIHFLNNAAKNVLGGPFSNPSIDTMRLTKGFLDAESGFRPHEYGNNTQPVSYNLNDLSNTTFNLPAFKPHDALEDALQTAYLFLFLVKKFKTGGIRNLNELYQAGRNWKIL